jgi:hypothetical protein
MRIALALASVGMTALLAEFAVRAVMPAGRLLSPTAIEVFAERAARESTMISADDELGHAPVLGGPWYDERGALRTSPRIDGEGAETQFVFLGDSVTRRGSLVNPLAAMWDGGKATFWNAGVESWNPVQEVAGWFRSQRAIAPQRVVLTLHNNDLTESTVACLRDGKLTLCNPGSFVPINPVAYRRSILYELFVHFRHVDRLRPEHYTFREREVERALQRLRDDVAQSGAELSIVLLPIFAKSNAWQEHERRARERELELLASLRIPFVDLQPVCDEITSAGLPVRVIETDPYHPDDACGAMLAFAAADLVLGPPPVRAVAESLVVAIGNKQRIAIDAFATHRGRDVALLPCGNDALPQRELDAKAIASAVRFRLDDEGRANATIAVPEGAQHGNLCWHRAVVLDASGAIVARSRPLPMRIAASVR